MPLPLPPLQSDTTRYSLLFKGAARVCAPRSDGSPTLSLEPGEDGAAYYRYKLDKGLTFTGLDFQVLKAINESTDRCQPLGLLLETRPHPYALFLSETQLTFTCNEVKWDYDACSATVTPATDDAYRRLLEGYDIEYNILATQALRTRVVSKLVELAQGVTLEYLRVGRDDQADHLGYEGWTMFLINTSYIDGTTTQNGLKETNNILFRYRLRGVPMTVQNVNGVLAYTPPDLSNSGWELLIPTGGISPTQTTIDYVKAPAISGFKPYKIGTYSNWNDPRNPGSVPLYGNELLLIDANKNPVDYGFNNDDYVAVTGPDGGYVTGGGGANSAECGGTSLRVRRTVDDEQCSKLLWRFGDFQFSRCFPLLAGLYSLLQQTVAATGQASILPPTYPQLSHFFTDALNLATGETGSLNELPGLLLSAASDVKRYRASEAATRVMVSLKQFLSDLCALYKCGWFINPVTGWLQIEHQAFFENAQAGGQEEDLPSYPDANQPRAFTFRQALLPRYEELMVSPANTQNISAGIYFDKAALDYGNVACVNTRADQNKVTRTSQRLTGDVAACVLSGDTIPDNALVVLAPNADKRLPQANAAVSPTLLLRRYHRHGAAAPTATVGSVAVVAASVKPAIEQATCTVGRCTLRGLGGSTRLKTNLGSGGQMGKAVLDLTTGVVSFTPWLQPPAATGPAPDLNSRDFSSAFASRFS